MPLYFSVASLGWGRDPLPTKDVQNTSPASRLADNLTRCLRKLLTFIQLSFTISEYNIHTSSQLPVSSGAGNLVREEASHKILRGQIGTTNS